MSSAWKSRPLGELCAILDSLRRPITKRDRTPGPVPYYGASGILDYVRGHIFDEPLVLIGEDGAKWEANAASSFAISGRSWVNNHAHVLRPHRDQIDDQWLIYYLNYADLTNFVTGLTVPKLNQEMLRSIPIPVPSVVEQQRIVSILDEAFNEITVEIEIATRQQHAAQDLLASAISASVASSDSLAKRRFEDCLLDVQYTPKVQRRDFKIKGAFPIVSQEAEFINGYWDVQDDVFEVTEPVIVFGDHTRILKFIDFDFVLGADGVKILRPIPEIDPKYFYYVLRATPIRQVGYARHYRFLKEIEITYPSLTRQRAIAAKLDELNFEIEALKASRSSKLSLLDDLKHSLLRRAFSGELTCQESLAANDNVFSTPEQVANVLAVLHYRHEQIGRDRTFGRVKAQKGLHLIESVGRVELGRTPWKDVAGPNDFPHMLKGEGWAKAEGFFEFVLRPDGGYDFVKLHNYQAMLSNARAATKPIDDAVRSVMDLIGVLDSREAEVVATVHAAWNNLILDGVEPTDDAILREARDRWHAKKLRIPETKFHEAIKLFRRKGIVPDGSAKRVAHRQPNLL